MGYVPMTRKEAGRLGGLANLIPRLERRRKAESYLRYRRCFVCDRRGYCPHREDAVIAAEVAARVRSGH